MICSDSSFDGNASGYGTQELYGSSPSNRGCLIGNEHETSWYYVNVGTAGTLEMTITPDNFGTSSLDDYDWAIWGPYTSLTANLNCPPTTDPIRCSHAGIPSNSTGTGNGITGLGNGAIDNSEGQGGDGWINFLNVLPGEVYILLIDGFLTGYSAKF